MSYSSYINPANSFMLIEVKSVDVEALIADAEARVRGALTAVGASESTITAAVEVERTSIRMNPTPGLLTKAQLETLERALIRSDLEPHIELTREGFSFPVFNYPITYAPGEVFLKLKMIHENARSVGLSLEGQIEFISDESRVMYSFSDSGVKKLLPISITYSDVAVEGPSAIQRTVEYSSR